MELTRTDAIRWRPNSNFCDPGWLVADCLGEITDTLRVDYWRERLDMIRRDDTWIDGDCPYQSDYALDSALSLGPGEEVILEFEGKKFRWFNGTAERNAIISMGVRDLSNQENEVAILNRLLTAMVWEHKVPIRKLWGVGGPRRPFPTAYSPRQSRGIQIDPVFLQYELSKTRTEKQWFALSLFKEAINSRSRFYSFLCFWKVIELAYPNTKTRKAWLDNVASVTTREKERVSKILVSTNDLESYLREERRHAIAHVFTQTRSSSKGKSLPVNPDDPSHEASISDDLTVVEDFARLAITELLK